VALGATTVTAGTAVGVTVGATSAEAATPHPAHIQQMTGTGPAVASTHSMTIRYRDSAGHITRVWHGTPADARELGAQWRAAHSRATPRIMKTSSCHLPTTYWVFHSSQLTCYAYSGSLRISLSGVYEMDSGNNVGYYRVGSHNHSLQRYTSDYWATGQHVTYIHIN